MHHSVANPSNSLIYDITDTIGEQPFGEVVVANHCMLYESILMHMNLGVLLTASLAYIYML